MVLAFTHHNLTMPNGGRAGNREIPPASRSLCALARTVRHNRVMRLQGFGWCTGITLAYGWCTYRVRMLYLWCTHGVRLEGVWYRTRAPGRGFNPPGPSSALPRRCWRSNPNYSIPLEDGRLIARVPVLTSSCDPTPPSSVSRSAGSWPASAPRLSGEPSQPAHPVA